MAESEASARERVKLNESWKALLIDEFDQSYMQALRGFLLEQKQARKVVFPRGEDIFAALDLTPPEQVKVVIIGQDPYHGPRQAHGLCFSVQSGVTEPPSLLNIFREIEQDMRDDAIPGGNSNGHFVRGKGCLTPWARQGVLLLNAVLTVERGRAGSHQGRGWERFTDRIVAELNERCEGLVFMLWGSYAQKKGASIDRHRHLVLSAPHPSPLSANRGFFGCRHFSQANRYLAAQGKTPINWFDVE